MFNTNYFRLNMLIVLLIFLFYGFLYILTDMLILPVCEGASLIWMSKLFHLYKVFLMNSSKNGDLPHLRVTFP